MEGKSGRRWPNNFLPETPEPELGGGGGTMLGATALLKKAAVYVMEGFSRTVRTPPRLRAACSEGWGVNKTGFFFFFFR